MEKHSVSLSDLLSCAASLIALVALAVFLRRSPHGRGGTFDPFSFTVVAACCTLYYTGPLIGEGRLSEAFELVQGLLSPASTTQLFRYVLLVMLINHLGAAGPAYRVSHGVAVLAAWLVHRELVLQGMYDYSQRYSGLWSLWPEPLRWLPHPGPPATPRFASLLCGAFGFAVPHATVQLTTMIRGFRGTSLQFADDRRAVLLGAVETTIWAALVVYAALVTVGEVLQVELLRFQADEGFAARKAPSGAFFGGLVVAALSLCLDAKWTTPRRNPAFIATDNRPISMPFVRRRDGADPSATRPERRPPPPQKCDVLVAGRASTDASGDASGDPGAAPPPRLHDRGRRVNFT